MIMCKALQFLELWKIDDKRVVEIYELVGGCMIHLVAERIIWANETLPGMYPVHALPKEVIVLQILG